MTDGANAFEYIRADLVSPAPRKPMTDPEEEHPAWTRIKAMHDHGDLAKLEQMVKVYDGLEAMGKIGSLLARFLAWCGGIGAAYLAVEWWIRGIK